MKGIGFFLLAAMLVFGAAGCSEDETTIVSNDPPNPDVVNPYSASSNTANSIAFEDVSAVLGATPLFEGYIRNVGSVKSEIFEVHFKLTSGDIAVQNDSMAALTATILEPGQRTRFESALSPAGKKQVTLTYWGMDGTKKTPEYTMEVQ